MLQSFKYFSPSSLSKALEFLDKNPGKTALLAGGTDLLVNMRSNIIEPELILDIKNIPELNGIFLNDCGDLIIGAAVTCSQAIKNPVIKNGFQFLQKAAEQLGSSQLRNRATLAGNLCTSSPCGDVSRALICLDASVEAVSVNTKRLIKLTDFFTGVKKNSLKDNELISRIIVPAAMAFRPGAHEKLKRIKGHDLALVSLSMIQALDSVRIAGGSCAPTPVLAVIDNPEPDLACVIEACEKTVCPVDDIRASADYRRFMIKKFAQRLMKKIKNGGLSK